MEHRHGARTPACLNVSVWDGDTHLGWYRTRDLGSGGLSIRGQVAGLTMNSIVRTTLEVLRDGEIRLVELHALVVHRNREATGMMWATDTGVLAQLEPWIERHAA